LTDEIWCAVRKLAGDRSRWVTSGFLEDGTKFHLLQIEPCETSLKAGPVR
jgi:hypothetical protein